MANYEVIELALEDDERRIFGKMYLPDEAQSGARVPLVVIAHGLGSNHEHGDAYAGEFARRGYAAYCFDFTGAARSQSTGPSADMTLSSEQEDMEFVYERLAKLSYVDLNNVFLMGMSMGGVVAALTAVRLRNRIKGLILLYPAFDIPAAIQEAFPDRDAIPDSQTVLGVELSRAYFVDAYYLDLFGLIGGYPGPVLIMHGVSDRVVASGCSVRASNVYAHAQLELIDGVGHGFEGGAFKYAVKRIVRFLDEEADLPDESGLDGDLNFGPTGMFG